MHKFIAIFLVALLVFPTSLQAGMLRRGVVAYGAVRTIQTGIVGARYLRQIRQVTGSLPTRAQLNHLKACLRDPVCATQSNPGRWASQKARVIGDWEKNVGQTWPRYAQDVWQNGKIIARKGDLYDGHHVVPKGAGGPHEWWNIHPVQRPDHQSVIHAAGSALKKLMGP